MSIGGAVAAAFASSACCLGPLVFAALGIKRATVDYDPAKVTPQQLVDVVNRLGYQASLPAKSGS